MSHTDFYRMGLIAYFTVLSPEFFVFSWKTFDYFQGKANHIRSVFKITADNYNEIKLEPPRVLQPSKTALQDGRAATMTITNFMDNISQNPENASSTDKNGPSAAPDGDIVLERCCEAVAAERAG